MYKIIDLDKSIANTVLKVNGFSFNDLDVDNFKLDLNQECLINFKNAILENKNKAFLIVGDYDFDGISATYIIDNLLDYLHIKHNYYIPSRTNEGYGISKAIVDKAKENNIDCLLLLDNGIVANEEIAYAYNLGMKVFIIDHHIYEKLPSVEAIIHPNLLTDDYKDTCTGGLTTLLTKLFYEDDFVEVLGGIATNADLTEVFKYNRYLQKRALYLLNNKRFYQMNYLSKKRVYSYEDFSFVIAPKINAISRLNKNANILVKYFKSDDASAFSLVKEIDEVNNQRKKLTLKMNNLALDKVDDNSNLIVVKDEEFLEGLCGIVSAKLCDKFHKPSIVLNSKNGLLKGSGRSFGNFDLFNYLNNIKDLFETFGGHKQAVGLSIKEENYDKLIRYIEDHPFEILDDEKVLIRINSEDLNEKALEEYERLMPFGTGFKEPLFLLENYNIKFKSLISNKYQKLLLDNELEAIYFKDDKQIKQGDKLIVRISKDAYNQKNSLIIDDVVE